MEFRDLPSGGRGDRAGTLCAGTAGTVEPDGAHALVGSVQIVAEMPHHFHADGGVVTQEPEKVFALDEDNLGGIQQFGAEFVGLAAQAGSHPQDFAGAGHAQHEALAAVRADRELGTAITEHVDAAAGTAFAEQKRALSENGLLLDFVEAAGGIRRHRAKGTI